MCISKFLYLALDRHDIDKGAVRKLNEPTKEDMGNVNRLARYLSGTRDAVTTLPKTGSMETLPAYIDSDFASCRTARTSTTGFCVELKGATPTAGCRMQGVVSRSSGEAEF